MIAKNIKLGKLMMALSIGKTNNNLSKNNYRAGTLCIHSTKKIMIKIIKIMKVEKKIKIKTMMMS